MRGFGQGAAGTDQTSGTRTAVIFLMPMKRGEKGG